MTTPYRVTVDVDGEARISHRSTAGSGTEVIEIGDPVCVRTRFLGSWTTGFEVAGLDDGGYVLRRVSDGALLSEAVAFEDVRKDTGSPPP